MRELHKTRRFARWLDGLRDQNGRARIQARLQRLAVGQPCDSKPVGSGVYELRIDTGPGYRVYYTERDATIILLLAGGDKSSQVRDIRAAHRLASQL